MPAGEAGTCTEVAQQHAAQVDANQDALAKQIEAVAQKKAEELAKAKKGELRRPPVTRAVTRPPMTTPMVMAPRREDRREGGHKKTANERRSPNPTLERRRRSRSGIMPGCSSDELRKAPRSWRSNLALARDRMIQRTAQDPHV